MSDKLINDKVIDIKTNLSNYGGVTLDTPLKGVSWFTVEEMMEAFITK